MDIVDWILDNYIWFFSGLGTTLLVVILTYRKSKESVNKVVQKNIRTITGDVVGRDKGGR